MSPEPYINHAMREMAEQMESGKGQAGQPLIPVGINAKTGDVVFAEARRRTWLDWMNEHGFIENKGAPQVVTLCGSTRFVETFNEWRKLLTLKGHIVLSIEIVTTQEPLLDPQRVDPETKEMLDLLHFEKIKLSDWIMVLNVGGYIGDSTRREIEFAQEMGIDVEYLVEADELTS